EKRRDMQLQAQKRKEETEARKKQLLEQKKAEERLKREADMLPANMLTSAQRFEQSKSRPGAISSNPLQTLAAVGAFRPGPTSISQTNSSQGLSQQGGAIPQSPRGRPQRGERGSSKRGNTGAAGVAMEK